VKALKANKEVLGMTIRHTATIFLAAIMATIVAVGFTAARPEAADAASTVKVRGCTGKRVTLDSNEKVMLNKHNRIRASKGLKKLCVHPALQRAAEAHSLDMIRKDYFSHNSKNGATPFQRMKREGYRFRTAGENIAYGSGSDGSPSRIFKSWMKSSGHRKNILNGKFREVGIGAYKGNFEGTNNVTMWTTDFGTR